MRPITRASEPLSLEIEDDEGKVCIRSFVVKEHSLKRGARFYELLNLAVKAETETGSLPTEDQEQHLWERVSLCIEPVLKMILAHPSDGQGEVSDEFVSELVLSQREAVLNAQIRVNRVEDVAPKVMAILIQIHAVRMAKLLMETSTGGNFASSWPIGPAPTPSESGPPTPDDKPSGSGDSDNEQSGGNETSDSALL